MTATITEARDQILDLFKTAWDAGGASSGLTVLYEGGPTADKPKDTSVSWARVAVRHNPVQPGKVTLGRAPDGKSRRTRTGNVFVQLFTPMGEGLQLADSLAIISQSAFEGKTTSPGNVIFRTVSVNEVGEEEGGWFQTNVTAQFEYDEIV